MTSLQRAVSLSVPAVVISCAIHVLATDSLFLLFALVGKRLPTFLTHVARRVVCATTLVVSAAAATLLSTTCNPHDPAPLNGKCFAAVASTSIALLAWTTCERACVALLRGRWRTGLRGRLATASALAMTYVLTADAEPVASLLLLVLLVRCARRAQSAVRARDSEPLVETDAKRRRALRTRQTLTVLSASLDVGVRAAVAHTVASTAMSEKAQVGAVLVVIALPLT